MNEHFGSTFSMSGIFHECPLTKKLTVTWITDLRMCIDRVSTANGPSSFSFGQLFFMGVFVCPFAFLSHSSVLPDISGISE